ncbi:hypothetical protein [Streptomyces prunicolor]|uniref:hypothetical protein n=1 Tax=Streptomyces prunicolor TaxID=67348 RepID=UPI003411080E
MAVLAVLIPPLMLGWVLALGKYEELLLAEQDPARPAPTVAPADAAPGPAPPPAPAKSPAYVPRLPAPSISYDSRQPFDAGLPRV